MPLPRVLSELDLHASAARFTREVALLLAAVLLLGFGAVQQVTSSQPVRVARSAVESSVPVAGPVAPVARRVPAAAKKATAQQRRTARRPRAKAARAVAHRPAAGPVQRWLPTGTGMWIHQWSRTEGGHAGLVVKRAKAAGLTHLFVKTGSSHDGWVGQQVLSQLLPATRGTDLKVVAWDFPTLVNPENDARRLAKAAWWRRPGVPMVAAVAPDIETASEGTHANRSSIERYYRTLRAALPARVAILATVPWPSENRISRYPYARTALHADAFIPMAYWYNRSPSRVTATSMRVLRRYGKPIFPVGQGYDGRLDAPYLKPDKHPGKSVDAFVFAARYFGARSVSLWSWQTTGMQQWMALHRASTTYAAKKPKPRPVTRTKTTRPGWHPGKGHGAKR